MSAYQVVLFDKKDRTPVEDFILSLSDSTIAKIFSRFELLELLGPDLGMPNVKRIVGTLYELRIRGREEVRLLFAISKTNIYVVHGFKKKKDRIPLKEIKIAQSRLTQI